MKYCDRCYSQSQNFKTNTISLYDDIDDDDIKDELELEFTGKDYYVQSTSVEDKNVNDENLELLAMKRNQEEMKKRAQAEERSLIDMVLGHTPHDGFVYIDSPTCAYVITAGHMTTVRTLYSAGHHTTHTSD